MPTNAGRNSQANPRASVTVLLAALSLLCLAGCATQSTPLPTSAKAGETALATDQSYWWYVRFRLDWADGQEPPWYPDLFIADRVIGPVLEAEQHQIALWRFHRRAARDAAGRQFSFIFYAPPATARRINARIAADHALVPWQRQRIVQEVVYDDPAEPQRPDIGDTSDPTWSAEMQSAWPYYIMGVSQLWLELIRNYGKTAALPRGAEARYMVLSRILDKLWRDEGGHALLHHLSAAFGYREVEITRRELLSF